MKKLLRWLAAGCLGGFANRLGLWLLGDTGVNAQLGVSISPNLSAAWLYPRLVWGGLWGLLFMLPMLQSKVLLKGSLLSLFPTVVQLFVVFPYKTRYGIAGLELGLLTPLIVVFANWLWGIATALTLRFAR